MQSLVAKACPLQKIVALLWFLLQSLQEQLPYLPKPFRVHDDSSWPSHGFERWISFDIPSGFPVLDRRSTGVTAPDEGERIKTPSFSIHYICCTVGPKWFRVTPLNDPSAFQIVSERSNSRGKFPG